MMTRTDRRRFPVLIAAIAALALAGAALGLLFSPVQAQEAGTLVSNTGKDADGTLSFTAIYSAQGFTTGSQAGGYVLSSIELDVSQVPNTPSHVTVELWSATSSSEPDASVATLTHSNGTWTTGLNTFNAPTDTRLRPEMTYFVFVSDVTPAGELLKIHYTDSSSADSGGASGWSVGRRAFTDEQGIQTGSYSQSDQRLKFKVNGYELRNRPSEIRAYWRDDPDNPHGSNEQAGCAGTESFRAFWERPKRADEWEAEVKPDYGASNVSFTMSNTDGRWPELTGTVRTNGFSTVSIRVRGRFGDDGWGAWSPVTELFCDGRPLSGSISTAVRGPEESSDTSEEQVSEESSGDSDGEETSKQPKSDDSSGNRKSTDGNAPRGTATSTAGGDSSDASESEEQQESPNTEETAASTVESEESSDDLGGGGTSEEQVSEESSDDSGGGGTSEEQVSEESSDDSGGEEPPTPTVELDGISASHSSVSENDGQTTITVTVTLDKAAAVDETITLAIVSPTEGKTAKQGEDFDATLDGTLTIAKGQRTGTAQLILTPKDNATADGPRAIAVQATSSSGHQALINIRIDDDEADSEADGSGMDDEADGEADDDDGEADDEMADGEDGEADDDGMALAFAGAVADQEYTAEAAITALQLPEAVGGEGDITYRVFDLPAGLTFDADTRTISGTPEAATDGAVEVTYLAQDSAGASAALTFSITVNPALRLGLGDS